MRVSTAKRKFNGFYYVKSCNDLVFNFNDLTDDCFFASKIDLLEACRIGDQKEYEKIDENHYLFDNGNIIEIAQL